MTPESETEPEPEPTPVTEEEEDISFSEADYDEHVLENRVYEVFENEQSWVSAQVRCAEWGGELAAITNWHLNEHISSRLIRDQEYWMGANDLSLEGRWVWNYGDPIGSFSRWARSQRRSNDCGAIDSEGFWHDDGCSEKKPFVCSKVPEWEYEAFDSMLRYPQAREACQEWGGDLASITNQEEQDKIELVLGTQKWYLIGANDLESEGDFTWSDGKAFEYSNWSRGQPAVRGDDQDCVAIDTFTFYQWADTEC